LHAVPAVSVTGPRAVESARKQTELNSIIIIQDGKKTENKGKSTWRKCMVCKKLSSKHLGHMYLKFDF
jgi:hypothetical protein